MAAIAENRGDWDTAKKYYTAIKDSSDASKAMQDRVLKNPKIRVLYNSGVDEVLDVSKGEVTGVRVRDFKANTTSDVPVTGLFIAIGHTPNTALFKGQLDLDEHGYIATHNGTHTSVPGVFAAGDVQDRIYRQAVTAAGTGCMAALDAERYLDGIPEEVLAEIA